MDPFNLFEALSSGNAREYDRAEKLLEAHAWTAADVPRLAQLLRNDDPLVRLHAARALQTLEGEASPALPVILELIRQDQDFVLVLHLIITVRKMGIAGAGATDVLIEYLSGSGKVRDSAVGALGAVGAESEAAKRLLRSIAATDECAMIRDRAHAALERMPGSTD